MKFDQCDKIKIIHENVVVLNYLSVKYDKTALKKQTKDYIAKNCQDIIVELLQNNELHASFNKEKCEETIGSYLKQYIQDERLISLTILTHHRILTKYHQKNKKKVKN